MTTLLERTLPLLILFSIIINTGCSSSLPKSNKLRNAEQLYQNTISNSNVVNYSKLELRKAEKTLLAARRAKSKKEMEAKAYISINQINTAINKAKTKAAFERIRNISKLLSELSKKENFDPN